MKSKQYPKDLYEDYKHLTKEYDGIMPAYEFGYLLIQFSVKMLMDLAPRHGTALETIKTATEEGIKWHVEEKALRDKKKRCSE